MQLIYYTGDFLKVYSKRYACLRLACFFTFFLYGVLSLVESNITNVANASEYVFLFITIAKLPAFKLQIYTINRQLETARLIVRFFDFPVFAANFLKYFYEESATKPASKTQAKKSKVIVVAKKCFTNIKTKNLQFLFWYIRPKSDRLLRFYRL